MGERKVRIAKLAAGTVVLAALFPCVAWAQDDGWIREEAGSAAEYLGLERLKEAVGEEGFAFEYQMGLDEQTAEEAGIAEGISWNSYYKVRAESDKINGRWMFDTGLVVMGSELLNVSLYGDRDMLALSLPQLYESSLGIRSGNLYEQLKGSWAEEAVGKIPEIYQEIELEFAPDEEELASWTEQIMEFLGWDRFKEDSIEVLKQFGDSLEIVRDDGYGETVYCVKTTWEDLEELCGGCEEIWTGYFSGQQAAGLALFGKVPGEWEETPKESVSETFRKLEKAIPEDPEIRFHVSGEKLERVECELALSAPQEEPLMAGDRAGQSDAQSEEPKETDSGLLDSEELKKNGLDELETENMSDESAADPGYLDLEIVFWGEDGDGESGTDVNLYAKDTDGNVLEGIYFTQTHFVDGAEIRDSMDIMQMGTLGEDGRTSDPGAVYYSQLLSSTFNKETGEYKVRLSLRDRDTGETAYLDLVSSFSDVVPGESFVWNIDRLAIGQEYEDLAALKGKILVQAGPTEELVKPEKVGMIFDMTEEEFSETIGTITRRLDSLLEMFS